MTRTPSTRVGAVIRSCMGEIERATATPSLATTEKRARALDVSLSDEISRCEQPVAG